MEKNMYQMFSNDGKGFVAGSFFLLMCFTGMANAALSGIEPGQPRFFTDKSAYVNYDYVKNRTSTLDFSTSKNIKWQSSVDPQSIESVKNSAIKVNVKLDVSNTSDPQVLAKSSIKVWGEIGSLAGQTTTPTGGAANLLFAANIVDLFWTTGQNGVIEFIMDGGSMKGQVCDLGYCSYANESLQFTLGSFNGNWAQDFKKGATVVATVPVPSAFWLLGSAILGMVQLGRRKAV